MIKSNLQKAKRQTFPFGYNYQNPPRNFYSPFENFGVRMKRDLAMSFSRVTEGAALAGYKWLGRGDKNAADGAAVGESCVAY
ncbi:fructose-bisphosphatase class II [Vibrio chagasii]|nr:fructose-bisphosphatase class II [Vibrio chagasii]